MLSETYNAKIVRIFVLSVLFKLKLSDRSELEYNWNMFRLKNLTIFFDENEWMTWYFTCFALQKKGGGKIIEYFNTQSYEYRVYSLIIYVQSFCIRTNMCTSKLNLILWPEFIDRKPHSVFRFHCRYFTKTRLFLSKQKNGSLNRNILLIHRSV